MPNEQFEYDWVDDDSMSAEETMRRFEALGPVPTTGPPRNDSRETAGTRVKATITSSTVDARIPGADTDSTSGAATITLAPAPPRPVLIGAASPSR